MSPFKTFTDFLSGFCAFVASFFLFREFLQFSPAENLSLGERLSLFFGTELLCDYRTYALLAVLFLLSALVGRCLCRYPTLTFPFSLLPFLYTFSLFRDGLLDERPMLYLLLGALGVCGGMADVIVADRQDGKRRCAVIGNGTALLTVGLCALVLWRADTVASLAESTPLAELSRFDRALVSAPAVDGDAWLWLAALLLCSVLFGLLFQGAYWIELLLTLPVSVLAWLWYADGRLAPHGELLLVLLTVTLLCRLSFTLLGGKTKKEQT